MAVDPLQQSRGDANDQPTGPTGFARLARRISAWTSRALVTLVVLVAGLGFGRQVLRWWGVEGAQPGRAAPPARGDLLGDPAQPLALEFGDQPWLVGRKGFSGDGRSAVTALRKACREGIDRGGPVEAGPSEQEKQMLADLARRRPDEESPGQWQLYELRGAVPMVVGVRSGAADIRPPEGARLADSLGRVVVWGLAVPDHGAGRIDNPSHEGPGRWTLYTFQARGPAGSSDAAEIPLPPDGRRLVAVRTTTGGAVATFTGSRQPEDWKRFYEDCAQRRGWRLEAAWRHVGPRWSARYADETGQRRTVVDVQFGPDHDGSLTGVVVVSPSS